MEGPPAPPECGQRLLVTLIDQRAAANHARPYYSIPVSQDASAGYRDISYRTFSNAVNRCAHWIIRTLGRSSHFEPLAYLGAPDLRYQIFLIAAAKTGHVMFFLSPRNSREAFLSLFQEGKASKLLTSSKHPPIVPSIVEAGNIQHIVVPEVEELLDEAPVPAIAFGKTWEEARRDPFVLLHTSGSTGLPKIVVLRHGFHTAADGFQLLSPNEIGQRYGNMRMFVPLPAFHVAGLCYTTSMPCWVDSTVVLPPATAPTPEIVNAVHVYGSVEHSFFPPSILTELAKNGDYLQNLERLKGVTFAGGPLSKETGYLISQRTKLNSSIGATEYLGIPMLPKPSEDFGYFKFNLHYGGLDFRERDPGLYEMVFVREKHLDLMQPVFITFPDLQEYPTKDIFSRHPEKPGLWKYESRLDDIIVFSNGEKLNPVTMEGIITSCPAVSGCLVVGQGKFQSALIVEPKEQAKDRLQLLEELWPFIQRANESCIKHGRLARDLIMFTKPGKPLARAGKGTVMRAASNKLYAQEIEELYTGIKHIEQSPFKMDLSDITNTKTSLAAYLRSEAGLGDIALNDDFFAWGLDSLQLIGLVRAINSVRGGPPIEAKLLYEHPTINKLAPVLQSTREAQDYYVTDPDEEDDKEKWLSMQEIFDRVTRDLPQNVPSRSRRWKQWVKLQSSGRPPIIQPDGGLTAWLQVMGSFLINFNNWGLVNSFGVFQAFYETHYLSRHSASEIAWIGTLQGALLLIVGSLSGPLFDKGYFQAILVIAGTLLVFAFMMLSLCTTYYQIMLSQGVLMGFCSGLLYIPSITLIPLYFKKRRGLALGLAVGGGSVGGVIYPLVFRNLLNSVGFAWAVRTMGFIALVLLITATLIIRPLGPRTRRQLIDLSAFGETPYLALVATAFFTFAAVLVPFFLSTIFATNQLHVSSDLSFSLLAVLNTAQFFGRVLPAWVSDITGAEIILLCANLTAGILGLCWIAVRDLGGYIAWAVVFGFVSGMEATLPAIVLPYICPSLASLGTRLGMVYMAAGFGFLISTPIATVADETKGVWFLGAQVWTGMCLMVATVFYTLTAWEAWKSRRLYESRKRAAF